MPRTWTWIVMVAFLLALAAPALAQTSTTAPAPSSTPSTSAPAPAAKAPAKTEAKKAEKAKSASGTVKSASADSLVIVSPKDKKELSFMLDKDTKITKAGKTATAADLAADETVTVSYTEADGKMHAKSVSVKKASKTAAKPKS